jgi:hypothetical protein
MEYRIVHNNANNVNNTNNAHNNISKHTVTNINLPELIKSNQYYQLTSFIKNYEDSLQKMFLSQKESDMLSNPTIFLWKVQKDGDNNDIFPNVVNMCLDDFGITFEGLTDEIVLTGPFVRSYINHSDEFPTRKELYMYKCSDKKWREFVDVEIFDETKTEYVLESDTFKLCLIKKRYRSPSHVILQHEYTKRIGWVNGTFYVSSMFLIEYQKHVNLFDTSYRDPVYGIPYDPLDIYESAIHDRYHPIKLLESVDIKTFSELPEKDFVRLYEIKKQSEKIRKTCIEFAIDKYCKEQHPILLNNLKQIILFLNQYQHKRPVGLYAKMVGLDTIHNELYEVLVETKNKYGIVSEIKYNNINEINLCVIDHCTKCDNPSWFNDYVKYVGYAITKDTIDIVIKHGALNILKYLITKKLISEDLMYYGILLSQHIDLAKMITFDVDIAINYLKDILELSLLRSFYFMYKLDNTITNTAFDLQQNILHMIKYTTNTSDINNTKDMIMLIMELKPELINTVDENGMTPVVFHAIHNPQLIQLFLEHEFDPTILDKDGNSFLHHLCKHNVPSLVKKSIQKCHELIDLPNKKAETPAITACVANNEDCFYVLKGAGADVNAQDTYGNTVYHYICKNSMCLAMMIENKKNYFGLTPKDYCQLAHTYYEFI